jgi:hypothetical protein
VWTFFTDSIDARSVAKQCDLLGVTVHQCSRGVAALAANWMGMSGGAVVVDHGGARRVVGIIVVVVSWLSDSGAACFTSLGWV